PCLPGRDAGPRALQARPGPVPGADHRRAGLPPPARDGPGAEGEQAARTAHPPAPPGGAIRLGSGLPRRRAGRRAWVAAAPAGAHDHARVQARESHGVLQGVVHLHRPEKTGEGAMTESRMNRRESPMNPNKPSKENTTGLLRLFVYGTLKQGYWNHERFCRGVLSVEEAVVRGRLYELPSGIPVLEVPEADVLAYGTADPLADVATQARFAEDLASILKPVPESATAGDC